MGRAFGLPLPGPLAGGASGLDVAPIHVPQVELLLHGGVLADRLHVPKERGVAGLVSLAHEPHGHLARLALQAVNACSSSEILKRVDGVSNVLVSDLFVLAVRLQNVLWLTVKEWAMLVSNQRPLPCEYTVASTVAYRSVREMFIKQPIS